LISLAQLAAGKSFKASSKLLTELCDMSQAVSGREFIRLLVPLHGLRLLDRHQLADRAGERRQRLGVGLARGCPFRQIGKMLLMRIELALGGPPELAHHRLAGDRGLLRLLRLHSRRGIAIVFGHVFLPEWRARKSRRLGSAAASFGHIS